MLLTAWQQQKSRCWRMLVFWLVLHVVCKLQSSMQFYLKHTACWLLQLLPQVLQQLQQEGSMELHREQQQEDSLGMQLGDARTFHV